MNEIDANKCGGYDEGKCYVEEYGTENAYCKDNPNCHYKQLQLLKQENERLKKNLLRCKNRSNVHYDDAKYLEQKLEKIKEYCKIHTDFCKNNKKNCELCPLEPCVDIQILQIIEGEENV